MELFQMRRVRPSDCHMGVRIITLKSSLVNPSEASFPGTMETRGTLWSRNLPVSAMKSLFLCLLVMSILMASFYGPRVSAFQRLISR